MGGKLTQLCTEGENWLFFFIFLFFWGQIGMMVEFDSGRKRMSFSGKPNLK